MDFDFGLDGDNNTATGGNLQDKDNVTDLGDTPKEPKPNLSDNDQGGDNPQNPNPADNDNPNDKGDDNGQEGESTTLEEGTIVSIDGVDYTVDANGNLLDKDNNIFKEKKDVGEYLKSFNNVDDNVDENEISIDNVRKAIGVELTDENGQPVEFENTIDGIKGYVSGVINAAAEDNYDTALNTLYTKFPFVEDIINYYVANGNSLEGYNQVPDRSGIEVISGNEQQQEAIIRQAWAELNRGGSVDNYIQYLKSGGLLEEEARNELKNLQDRDATYKKQLEAEAERVEEQQQEYLVNYWRTVNSVVNSGKLAGYDIPDTITINRDGRKQAVTRNDFFNYLYQVDSEGKSMYERDLEKMDENTQLQDQLLRAYLTFTGGSYSSLVAMAANKADVKRLRLTASTKKNSNVKVTKPSSNKNSKDIDFGL